MYEGRKADVCGVGGELTSPVCPDQMDWATYYPAYFATKGGAPEPMDIATSSADDLGGAIAFRKTGIVDVVDIGCGFGGLLVALGPRLPTSVILGRSDSTSGGG